MLSLIETFIAMKCWSSQQEIFETQKGYNSESRKVS